MFKKMRRLFSVALVLSMLISTGLQVGACDFSELEKSLEPYAEEEQRRIDTITNSPNSEDWLGVVIENVPLDNDIEPYMMCQDCSWMMVSVCAKEAILVDEGYHTGLLGSAQTNCYAYYFESRGAIMCSLCYKVGYQGGQHACWEIHKKCSKGEYDVCPMEVS